MKIDQSRYATFWQNPERYRLIYEQNIVPAVPNYSLQRGIAFHLIADLTHQGRSEEEVRAVLTGQTPDPSGRILTLSNEAIQSAFALWEYVRTNSELAQSETLASELEFEFEVGMGSPHVGVGRIDRIIEHEGDLYLLEFKTTNPRRRVDQAYTDWASNKQADFQILGARELGYDVRGLLVLYVVESVPPSLWQPLTITRTQEQLQRSRVEIHETCEIIELLRRVVGPDVPWPHIANWPCSQAGRCEYEAICGQAGRLEPPDGFTRRVEHLAILREAGAAP